MKLIKLSCRWALALAVAAAATSCDDDKSYAELLTDENIATNAFLADQRVVGYDPDNKTFESGQTAPYYQLDEDGNVYMQVISEGTKDNMAEDDQLIYFRFTRYNLYEYADGKLGPGSGNDTDLTYGSASFRFGNTSSQSSYQWGSGLQMPLRYLPIDCEVNLVIKSQAGLYNEISNVQPFLYKVRYFKPQT